MAVAHCGNKDTCDNSREYSLAQALLEPAIYSPRCDPTQQPVGTSAGISGQKTNSAGTQPHLSAHSMLKAFLSTQLPAQHTPLQSTAHQRDKTHSLPPGGLHKSLRQYHPPGGRQQKQEELQPCSPWNTNHNHRKSDKNETTEEYVPDEGTR